ncbi:MAG TPA: putative sulfate/molybdate transporter [Actinomycetota bacterium]|nr:putative sulfate/molybdate transporter [Actinomycetota bacterium]
MRTPPLTARAAAIERRSPFRIGLGEAAGAVADLGVMVPLTTALILVNGLDAGAVLVCAGLLVLGSGLVFRIPFPVQPLKALTAVAVAQRLAPDVIHAAGLEIAALLVLLSVHHVADVVARVFTQPVVRALQLGVGVLLAITASKLVLDPPDVFAATPASPWPWMLMLAAFAGIVVAARSRRYWIALAILVSGTAVAVVVATPDLSGPSLSIPMIELPPGSAFATAFFLLVVPQLPLTFGNAVVAVDRLAHEYLGPAASRVSPSRVCLSAGIGNAVSGVLGGIPMCHGAGGLTAHVRLGARTAGMNLVLAGAFLALGLFFAPDVPQVLGLLPVWGLAAFLAYAGARHAWLVTDLRGWDLGLAVAAGALGAWAGNLAVTAAIALTAVHGRRVLAARIGVGTPAGSTRRRRTPLP